MSSRPATAQEKGSGRFKLVATLAVLGIAGMLAMRIVPVYVKEASLQNDLKEVSRRAAFSSVRTTEQDIRNFVDEKLREYNLPDDTTVEVKRAGKTVIIRVSCDIPIDLVLTTYFYPLKVEATETSF